MSPTSWITSQAFAERAGISVQAARAALRASLDGTSWRGVRLDVRRRLGRGGRSGLVYEVALSSLPLDLVGVVEHQFAGAQSPLPQVINSDPRVLERLKLITPILKASPTSRARAEAVLLTSAATDISVRTLYRWIRRYEDFGVRGLARTRPSNAGRPRVAVSRQFDRAWRCSGLDEATLAQIGSELTDTLKGLWASRAEQAGVTEVRRLAEFLLSEICDRHGVNLPLEALRLSRRGAERFAHFRIVNTRRNDRKAFDDGKPRIRRDWTAFAPMERVVGDVKHLDVIVTRPDGTPAWPKIVAFMDAGTGRVFVHPVLLPRGEGVRQEHVTEAFLAMVADPAWGFPLGLYLDNGGEFGALVKIDGALQLLNEAGARTIIHARPYNAAAKPIESLFARLDRYVFALLPGYAGPDRMSKKTQTVGRPPTPFPGSWEEFCETLQDLIRTYNHRPIGGLWDDRSPEDWLAQKIDGGWRAVRVAPCELDAAFSDPESRRVDRGVLKINGRRYTHDALAALPSRTVVDLALPWRRGAAPLAQIEGAWVYLAPEVAYPARWVEGARVSSQRQGRQAHYVAALRKDAPVIDPVATKVRMARQLKGAIPPLSGPGLDLGAEARARGDAIKAGVEAPPAASAADERRARERALTERLERAQQQHD